MKPIRCDFGQRQQYEGTLVHSRVWQDRCYVTDHIIVRDQVEIERTRRVRLAALPPEMRFDVSEPLKQRRRIQIRFDGDDCIEVVGLIRFRHRRTPVKARPRHNLAAFLCEGTQCVLKRRARRSDVAWQIGAQRNEDHSLQTFGKRGGLTPATRQRSNERHNVVVIGWSYA